MKQDNVTNEDLIRAAERHEKVMADWYEASVKNNIFQRFWHQRRMAMVENYSKGISGKILDIGCADGYLTNCIAKATVPTKIVGTDVLDGSLAYARKRYDSGLFSFVRADAQSLPFEDNYFDAVYLLEVIEHLEKPEMCLHEIYRVMKNKGNMFVLVPSESICFKVIWWLWTQFKGKVWKNTHLNIMSIEELRMTLKKIGLKVVKEDYFMWGMLFIIKAQKDV